MTEQFAADVLICGAGAAGLTLAIDLARRGVSFRLIEKMDDPFRGSRGKGIQPRTQEVFEDLGILDRIVAASGVFPKQREYRDDGTFTDCVVMEQQEPTPTEPYQLALMAPQFLTESVMRERLAELGQRPQFSSELVGFDLDADVLGLATKLLDAAKRGDMRRGREVHQLDLGYPGSSLALEVPQRTRGPLAGDRAPDALIRGAAGHSIRLFSLFKGPHWTMIGQDAARNAVAARPGLHAHTLGSRGDLVDDGGSFRNAYALESGDWLLVRPDGYIGAIVGRDDLGSLENYLNGVGVVSSTRGA